MEIKRTGIRDWWRADFLGLQVLQPCQGGGRAPLQLFLVALRIMCGTKAKPPGKGFGSKVGKGWSQGPSTQALERPHGCEWGGITEGEPSETLCQAGRGQGMLLRK